MDKTAPDWDAWARSLEQFSSDYEPRPGDDGLAVQERLSRRASNIAIDPDELEADITEAISHAQRQ